MTVRVLLKQVHSGLRTIGPKARVETAAALLHGNTIGALPVVDERGRLVGIVSERDVVSVIATRGAGGLGALVEEIMSRNVATMTCDDSVRDVERLMNTRRIRHVPILDGEDLVAIVSIRDVVKYRLMAVEMEKNVLRDFALVARH